MAQFGDALAELCKWAASPVARDEFAWTVPAAYAMSFELSREELRKATSRDARRLATPAWERVMARARAGEDLTLPQPLRLEELRKPATDETVRRAFESIKAKLGGL